MYARYRDIAKQNARDHIINKLLDIAYFFPGTSGSLFHHADLPRMNFIAKIYTASSK